MFNTLANAVQSNNDMRVVVDFANSFTCSIINAINSSVAGDNSAHFSACVSAAESQP